MQGEDEEDPLEHANVQKKSGKGRALKRMGPCDSSMQAGLVDDDDAEKVLNFLLSISGLWNSYIS